MRKFIILALLVFVVRSGLSQEETSENYYIIDNNELVCDFDLYEVRDQLNYPYFYKGGPDIRGLLIVAEKSTADVVSGVKLGKDVLARLFTLKRNGKKYPLQIKFFTLRNTGARPGRIRYINAYEFVIPIDSLRIGLYELHIEISIKGKKIRLETSLADTTYRSFRVKKAKTQAEYEEMQIDIAKSKKGADAIKYICELLRNKKIRNMKTINILMGFLFTANLKEKKNIDAAAWFLCLYRNLDSYNPMAFTMTAEHSFNMPEVFKKGREIEEKIKSFKKIYLQNVKFKHSPNDLTFNSVFKRLSELRKRRARGRDRRGLDE